MKYLAAGSPDGREIANAYGQTADHYFYHENMMHGQNNENSKTIMAQLETPVPQAPLVANASMPNQDNAAKKREKDKAYRERLKKRRIEMVVKVETLTEENKVLKRENTALTAENTLQKQAFLSRGKEMEKLKHELNESRYELKKQNALAQAVSDIVARSGLSLRDEEIQKLKIEIDLLRQGIGMDNLSLQLMKENAKLKYELEKVKHEKRALEVQVDAVCGKISAENPSP